MRKYILPCAGYDRPGGDISRIVVERLTGNRDDVIIGSMGALYKERPAEMRDFRTSDVICIDGCGTSCASELAVARGRNDCAVVSVPDAAASGESFDEKVGHVIDAMLQYLDKRVVKSKPAMVEESSPPLDYLKESFDKFTLRVAKGMKYSDNDFWVHVEGQSVRIGVSDFLQQMMSDVYFVDLVEKGTYVSMFDDAGAMESTKILVEFIVPISGTIVEVNRTLEDSPELINVSPYERGWIYVIRPDDIGELELLKDASEYMEYVLEKAKREIGTKVV